MRSGGGYIQDRGVSRWDTCAAEACIEAHGGVLLKLLPVVTSPTTFSADSTTWPPDCRYHYRASTTNQDFLSGTSALTMHNATDVASLADGRVQLATDVTQVKPYANLLGLFALAAPADIASSVAMITAAAATAPPRYD